MAGCMAARTDPLLVPNARRTRRAADARGCACTRNLSAGLAAGLERVGGDDPDHVPRLHELAPGLYAGLGYNGRGIAAATMMGRDLAALALGRGETVFPRVSLRPLPYARVAPLLVRGLARWYRVRDVLEEVRLK